MYLVNQLIGVSPVLLHVAVLVTTEKSVGYGSREEVLQSGKKAAVRRLAAVVRVRVRD